MNMKCHLGTDYNNNICRNSEDLSDNNICMNSDDLADDKKDNDHVMLINFNHDV